MRRYGAPALAAIVLVALSVSSPRLAASRAQSEPQTWQVQAGGDVVEEGIQTHAYYPRAFTIRAGDTVEWRFAGLTSITFAPYRSLFENFIPGPEPGDLTLGPLFFPSGPTEPNPVYDGSGLANSGLPLAPLDEVPPYRLIFVRPGLYTYFDVIHPGTFGMVQVLPADAPLVETPAQAAARGQGELALILADIRAQIGGYRPVQQPGPGGSTIQVAAAAISSGLGAGANRYLPAALTVRRGDTIVWTNGDDYAPHTITFTSGGPLPPFVEARLQPSGPPLFVAPGVALGPSGGTVYTGSGFLSSGLVPYGNSFAVTFDAPPGTYEFACVLHTAFNQRGTVTVTE